MELNKKYFGGYFRDKLYKLRIVPIQNNLPPGRDLEYSLGGKQKEEEEDRRAKRKREEEKGRNGPVRSEEERAARGRSLKLAVKQFRASYFSLTSYNKVDLARLKDRIKREKEEGINLAQDLQKFIDNFE